MLFPAKKILRRLKSSVLTVYSQAIRSNLILRGFSSTDQFHDEPLFVPGSDVKSLVKSELPTISEEENCIVSAEYNSVYDSQGNSIHCSALLRGPKQKRINAPLHVENETSGAPRYLDEAIFGGVLFATHYGHLVTESTARLWPYFLPSMAGSLGNKKLLFRVAGSKKVAIGEISENAKTLFKALGVFEQIEVVDAPIQVGRLTIPHAANVNSRKAHKIFREQLKASGQNILRSCGEDRQGSWKNKRVYLSRSKLSNLYRKPGLERELEALLEKHGYITVHPQQLSLANQIQLFSEAKELVGTIGSAFHTMLFSQNPNMCAKYLTGDTVIETFRVIDSICGADSKYVRCLYKNPLSISGNQDMVIDLSRALAGILDQ